MQRIVLGIDFGMSNSRIAYIDKYHKPVVIHNQEYKTLTPLM
jgi:molecular chaperone DnaK (HSP70)